VDNRQAALPERKGKKRKGKERKTTQAAKHSLH
jgi:hypothetical protein